MPAQTLAAPFTPVARKIDLSDDALAGKVRRIGFHHLAHKLVAGRTAKAVVAALKFEIGVADAAGQQPYESETLRPARSRNTARLDASVLNVNSKHEQFSIKPAAILAASSTPPNAVEVEGAPIRAPAPDLRDSAARPRTNNPAVETAALYATIRMSSGAPRRNSKA